MLVVAYSAYILYSWKKGGGITLPFPPNGQIEKLVQNQIEDECGLRRRDVLCYAQHSLVVIPNFLANVLPSSDKYVRRQHLTGLIVVGELRRVIPVNLDVPLLATDFDWELERVFSEHGRQLMRSHRETGNQLERTSYLQLYKEYRNRAKLLRIKKFKFHIYYPSLFFLGFLFLNCILYPFSILWATLWVKYNIYISL